MPKKARVRDYDQFIVRLPPGMRDRIKAKAERAGMSMNEAIVWVLEKHFPEPVTLEERLEHLAEFVAMLKNSKEPNEAIESLIGEIRETVELIASGKIPTQKSFRDMVSTRLTEWEEAEIEDWGSKNSNPFDDTDQGRSGPDDDIPF